MQSRGFILLTAMIILFLWSFLLISLLQGVSLHTKTAGILDQKRQQFYQLEQVAEIIFNANHPIDCYLDQINPNQIIKLLKNAGCNFEYQKLNYTFLIDNLGLFPCLQIQEENKIYSSKQWLITVKNEHTILQKRIAKPWVQTLCLGEKKLIKSGIMSWRYLDDQEFHDNIAS